VGQKKRRKKKTAASSRAKQKPASGRPRFDFADAEVFTTATVTLGMRLRKELGFKYEDPVKSLEAMGLPTEWADEAADEMERLLVESQRGPGRPRKSAEELTRHPNSQEVSLAVLHFLARNPGAFHKRKERCYYNDDFKLFVLDTLLAPDGLAADMTVRQAAHAIRMPAHTLTAWLAARRKAAREKE